jgi:hypothetical protein
MNRFLSRPVHNAPALETVDIALMANSSVRWRSQPRTGGAPAQPPMGVQPG